MKASRYNVRVDEPGGKTLLFNSATAALVAVEPEERPRVERLLEGAEPADPCDAALREALRSQGFLVEDLADELAGQKIRNRRARFSRSTFLLTVAPTLGCNLECAYCFQRELAGRPMSRETEAALVSFCNLRLPGSEEMLVTWFGGEPLLRLDTVERVHLALAETAARHDVAMHPGSIVTNGFLLDPVVARRLAAAEIHEVQVTLDGPRRVHDARRRLKDGNGSFEWILRGIESAADLLHVTVRVNLDHANESTAGEVLEVLESRGLLSRVGVYFAPVVEDALPCGTLQDRCFGSAEFPVRLAALHERLLEDGRALVAYPDLTPGSSCGADCDHAFVVGPDGRLYKCWEDLGHAGSAVGSLHGAEPTPEETSALERYLAWDPFEKDGCRECDLLPICMGGCPRRAIRLGLPDRGDCCMWKHNLAPMLEIRHRVENGKEEANAPPASSPSSAEPQEGPAIDA